MVGRQRKIIVRFGMEPKEAGGCLQDEIPCYFPAHSLVDYESPMFMRVQR